MVGRIASALAETLVKSEFVRGDRKNDEIWMYGGIAV